MIHPTVEEIRTLPSGCYIRKDNNICVRVNVKANTLRFICPFCYESYNQDGRPRAKSKHREHVHGYDGLTSFYQGERVPHCNKGRNPIENGVFQLYYVP